MSAHGAHNGQLVFYFFVYLQRMRTWSVVLVRGSGEIENQANDSRRKMKKSCDAEKARINKHKAQEIDGNKCAKIRVK